MSRSFTPPDTLSKEEIRTLADVRRDIWTNSFQGLGYGSLAGITSHLLLQAAKNRGLLKSMKLDRNTMTLAFLGGGALGSFLFGTVAGKNQVHTLHPIFQVGAMPPDLRTDYQKSIDEATGKAAEKPDTTKDDVEDDLEHRRRNRMMRRASLNNVLQNQHGLNDSRGGQWIPETKFSTETTEDILNNRILRRNTLKNSLGITGDPK